MTSQRTKISAEARLAVLRLFKEDHQRLRAGFQKFARLQQTDKQEIYAGLLEEICDLLEVHLSLEEEIFYPAIRSAIASPLRVEEAEVEHLTLKMLLAELCETTGPWHRRHDVVFAVLGAYVMSHIHNVERQIFVQLGAVQVDWSGMLYALQQRQAALQVQLEDQREKMRTRELTQLNGSTHYMAVLPGKATTTH